MFLWQYSSEPQAIRILADVAPCYLKVTKNCGHKNSIKHFLKSFILKFFQYDKTELLWIQLFLSS